MRLLILYGSQTGTAQDYAEQIWRDSKKYSLKGSVMALDNYDIKKLITEHLVLFVVSTTGQGEEPDNMKRFWKFLLRRNLPTNSLQNLKFACLGLGDSSYEKYNFVAKKLNKRLLQLSASPILPLGLCDDQHDLGVAGTYLPWIKNFWAALKTTHHLVIQEHLFNSYAYKWNVLECNSPPNVDFKQLQWPSNADTIAFNVTKNTRTTSEDHFQDVRLIAFYSKDVLWSPGDIFCVKPLNSDSKVDHLFNIFMEHNLPFNKDTVVQFEETDAEMPLPFCYTQSMSLGTAAKYVWDLNAIPRPRVFEILALNCIDELEKDKLTELTTPEGLEDLVNYANRPRRTVLEVLGDFPNAVSKLKLPLLFEIFQIIQPRSFSIASIPESKSLEILVAVVEYKTKMSELRKGLCSNWLKSLNINDEIYATIKRGTMQFPKDPNVPIVIVGPGTGIAPFRSILLNFELYCSNQERSKCVVFFGCRSQHKDFHFKEDFDRFKSKEIAKFYYAFSRDQERKVYVQHLIKENSNELKDLITSQDCVIMVAGASKNMPKAVKEAFMEVVDGNADYITKMCKLKRYQEETW